MNIVYRSSKLDLSHLVLC